MAELGIRWTIGDVSDGGFEALRLSVTGVRQLFGDSPRYVVFVNTVAVDEARRRSGLASVDWLEWQDATREIPAWLREHLDDGLAEGVAWKFAPLQAFPDRHELYLDNDVILWDVPDAMRAWLFDDGSCLVAEDVKACFGQFSERCGPHGRNLGIRGLPPGFDLEASLRQVLEDHPVQLTSELDEQGLQLAALSRDRRVHVVSLDDVTICSPFWPHLQHLGRCGAHFCGLNAKRLGWSLDDRPAEEFVREHWVRHRPEVLARLRPRRLPGEVREQAARGRA